MSDGDSRGQPPEICVSCRFGTGPRRDCTLIVGGRLQTLLDEGPCEIPDFMRQATASAVARSHPFGRDHASDIAQESILRLLERRESFPGKTLQRLPELKRWLRRFVRNHVIDSLRQARILTKLRCGACVRFTTTQPGRCTLEFLPDLGEGLRPNPWWGERVLRATDPRSLEPPCEEFEWRKPGIVDIFENEIAAPGSGRPQRARDLIVLGLDRLAARGERALREAAALQSHYLAGETIAVIAKRSRVSEKTVKRLLSSGREALLDVLRREFGVESITEVVS